MISKNRRTKAVPIKQPVPVKKKAVKKPITKAKAKKKAVAKAPKKKKERKDYLNIAQVVKMIQTRKGKEAVKILRKFQCKADEGCGLIRFRGDLCYNHYHMMLRFGRTSHVNTIHTGELCVECEKRPATNKEYCLACFLRLDRKGKIKNKRKRNVKKPV